MAAGRGVRMGSTTKKQYIEIAKKPILAWTISAFDRVKEIDEIYVVVPKDDLYFVQHEILEKFSFKHQVVIVPGGVERQNSVYEGLKAVNNQCQWVLIHDGVRPFIKKSLIYKVMKAVKEKSAITLGIPARDTIKIAKDMQVIKTEDRENIWCAQTPQAFELSKIKDAYEFANKKNILVTDDAGILEHFGQAVSLLEGDYYNIKITTPDDLLVAEKLIPIYFNQ
jgi:2-C-methyl-D-erythritol 4-phosphate cytidylyltransferase